VNIQKIEEKTNPNNKKQAVFIMAYSETDIWRNYHGVSKEAQETIVPLVLMLQRYDGTIGFVGGQVDDGEDLLASAVREFKEETGYSLSSDQIRKFEFACSHETDKMVTHLMTIKVSEFVLKDIIANSYKAEHFMSEGTLFTTHMINYPHMRSFDNFMKNNFAPTVKEEIMEVIEKLNWKEKYNL
jgi:U8 snoRNA-decapping enzyme